MFSHPLPCEQAYFAKYDAVERYLSKRTYPPGLSYVEKNTFRRFCKKFVIKGLYELWIKVTEIKVVKVGLDEKKFTVISPPLMSHMMAWHLPIIIKSWVCYLLNIASLGFLQMTSSTSWGAIGCAWFWGADSRWRRLWPTTTTSSTTSTPTSVSGCSTRGERNDSSRLFVISFHHQ